MSKQEINDLQTKYPELTEDELKSYAIERKRWFKGTIAVSVIYGVFGTGLLLLVLFNSSIKTFITESYLPFIVTLVGGIIFIITLLVIQILTFKPKSLQKTIYDSDLCPDYWQFVPLTPEEKYSLPDYLDDNQKKLMSYKCVAPSDKEGVPIIYYPQGRYHSNGVEFLDLNDENSATITTNFKNSGNVYNQKLSVPSMAFYKEISEEYRGTNVSASAKKKAAYALSDNGDAETSQIAKNMYNILDNTTSQPMNNAVNCGVVYPRYLAVKDAKLFKENPNKLRCEYSKLCGVPWTNVCPQVDTISSGTDF